MFDTVLLRSFVAVVQEGGFTHAAARLNLTQSAVSAHLRRLEKQVGRDLLVRTTRSVALTVDGELLLGYARAILALNQDARAQLLREPSAGTIRVGLSEDLANVRLMHVMKAFAGRYPRIAFSIRVGIPGDLLQALDHGELDVVMGGRCHGGPAGRVLWREPLVWAGADWASLTPGAPVPIALLPEPCPYREASLAALARAGVDYRIVLVCPSGAGLCAAAHAGLAVTPIVHTQLAHGLRAIPPDAGLPALPDVEFTMFAAPGASARVVDELGNAIVLAFAHNA
ncbi:MULTISPECIES: LysR substrate-binding domain-containing protein [unclassified Burkholderia]|uniref:LysR substrate-binding domain-containing protein n=1 Tax=unclassified Burkholderia TaxID=2613784 RepID=UPI000F569718|nr:MULTISPECIES: LysR substrate-binding domain-containing protein [unclassified Burkholderia]RQR70600.1 LysR family transcriptional regulator [Burkholderia sp. Bp9011]RQR92428.1 LysR family transcriptional regulator [Burkholderia sp. Bp9010]RQS10616.1 LysR family transcriptional regulator [Burkholderia sp. Bp8991]RQS77568.1 LysR family transcriptional regulator [Burkholderia sp. Bp8977]